MGSEHPEITVVVPALNEEQSLPHLVGLLVPILEAASEGFEIVIVNDGSTDRTSAVITEQSQLDHRVRGVHLARNFGHEAAILAGLSEAAGDAVIVMDADLQDAPSSLPRLIREWRAGADVVYAVRTGRKESAPLRAAMSAYYRIAGRTMSVDLPRDAGPFSLMDRVVVEELLNMHERGRYFPGLRAFTGFNQVGVQVERGSRFAGTTKYPLVRRTTLALEALMSFSVLPLRAVVVLGLISAVLAVMFGIAIVLLVLSGARVVPGWASIMTVVLLLTGIQMLTLGIVGEYVGRVFDEVRRRPSFIIAARSHEGRLVTRRRSVPTQRGGTGSEPSSE